MSKILSFFNNKGGVGKTTFMYHVGHLLAQEGKKVLLVDCDSQCNLTAYCLNDDEIDAIWNDTNGNSIYQVIEPVYEGIGDIKSIDPIIIANNLFLSPGDLRLSVYEDRLGDTWNSSKGGSLPDIRPQAAIYRYIKQSINNLSIDYVLIDLGPNLGALNRAVLGGTDYFITPLACDLFSIKGTENLGKKLVTWANEWEAINRAFSGGIPIPKGKPKFLGYVLQMYNVRNSTTGATQGWSSFKNKIEPSVLTNLVNPLNSIRQVVTSKNYNLAEIPNLHSLVPYSLEARKPIFDCSSNDGLRGAHITTAKGTKMLYKKIVDIIIALP